jgi:hypothetical protein
MFSTPCSLCEFVRTDPPGCEAGQFCVGDDRGCGTPGFCRLFGRATSEKAQEPIESRIQRARERSSLKFDLVILFDERYHTGEELRKSVTQRYPHCEKMIVIDTTGNGRRTGVARKVLAEEGVQRPYNLECLVDSEQTPLATVDWAQRLIEAPYFLVLAAGRIIHDIGEWATHLLATDSRVIHWYFPIALGGSLFLQPTGVNGAWITAAYRQMGGSATRSIFEKMADEETQRLCGLSWLIDGATLE